MVSISSPPSPTNAHDVFTEIRFWCVRMILPQVHPPGLTATRRWEAFWAGRGPAGPLGIRCYLLLVAYLLANAYVLLLLLFIGVYMFICLLFIIYLLVYICLYMYICLYCLFIRLYVCWPAGPLGMQPQPIKAYYVFFIIFTFYFIFDGFFFLFVFFSFSIPSRCVHVVLAQGPC